MDHPLFDTDAVRDRRRLDRRDSDGIAKVFDVNAVRFYAARVCDVSPGGLRLTFPVPLQSKPGALLQVYLGPERFVRRADMTPARLCWRMDSGRGMSAGIEWLEQRAAQPTTLRRAA